VAEKIRRRFFSELCMHRGQVVKLRERSEETFMRKKANMNSQDCEWRGKGEMVPTLSGIKKKGNEKRGERER
jgi:hypothetical protein